MSRPRRMQRYPDHGPNRHKARVCVRLKKLGERMRDLAIELDLIDEAFKAGQLRGVAQTTHRWATELAPPTHPCRTAIEA